MGKGSSKGHTPREAKDNLKSTQLLSVIDAISEGPIEGPVDGLKSVLLNSTPVLDTEGNTNISGVTVVFRAGEQEQTPPEGFESSGSETVLGTEVKYDTPITRTITSANIDRLRFTFGVQALVETTSKGDRNPSEVRLLVQIQRNGGWVTEKDITIKGKTTSQYLASVVMGNLPPRPFNIRMRRMTPDSTTDQLQNKTLWSSYTEIIDVKQCYPNTALVGVQVDSEQFGSQQVSRNYHLRGRILQVPSNYNPQTRQYSGIWDGTFKPAYSNNMAWCLWDMLHTGNSYDHDYEFGSRGDVTFKSALQFSGSPQCLGELRLDRLRSYGRIRSERSSGSGDADSRTEYLRERVRKTR